MVSLTTSVNQCVALPELSVESSSSYLRFLVIVDPVQYVLLQVLLQSQLSRTG